MPQQVITISCNASINRAVRLAVEAANRVQTSWHLVQTDLGDFQEANPKKLANRVLAKASPGPLIFVTDVQFDDNWFSHEFRGVAVISAHGFGAIGTPFTVEAHVLYQLCAALLCFSLDIDEGDLLPFAHDPARGCILDMVSYKPHVTKGMESGQLCEDCRNIHLRKIGLSEAALASIGAILNQVPRMKTSPESTTGRRYFSILHLSDLHLGPSYRFKPRLINSGPPPIYESAGALRNLARMVVGDLKRTAEDLAMAVETRTLAQRIDLIVISGDVADTAQESEYGQAINFINELLQGINVLRAREAMVPLTIQQVVCIPGNHDVNWQAPNNKDKFLEYAKFWHTLTGNGEYFNVDPNQIVYRKQIQAEGGDVVICGFNSCVMNHENPALREIGIVERTQLDSTTEWLNGLDLRRSRKVAIVNHHPVYIPSLETEQDAHYDAILQAGQFLSYLQNNDFDLILHGHKHYPMIWTHNMRPYEARTLDRWSDPVIVSSGSLSAGRRSLPGNVPNAYQIIGLRVRPDPLRAKTTVIRRALSAGDLLPNQEFELDGVWHLGTDPPGRSGAQPDPPFGSGVEGGQEMAHSDVARRTSYAKAHGWMMSHRYRPSRSADQSYDISIYLIRHPSQTESSVRPRRVIYNVGKNWRGSPFIVENKVENFELRLSAYGSFLCIATIEFTDGTAHTAERYIDFEMSDLISE